MNSDFIVDLSQSCLLQVKFHKSIVVICIDHDLLQWMILQRLAGTECVHCFVLL
jgi:hypothetical protein